MGVRVGILTGGCDLVLTNVVWYVGRLGNGQVHHLLSGLQGCYSLLVCHIIQIGFINLSIRRLGYFTKLSLYTFDINVHWVYALLPSYYSRNNLFL